MRRVELAHRFRHPGIVRTILDRRHPARLVVEQVLRLRLGLLRRAELGQVLRGHNLAAEVGHPEVTALLVFVDQPHAGHLALRFLGQRLEQGAKEPVEIGLAHEQVERVFGDLGLNVGQALCATPFGGFVPQRRAQRAHVA
jgi:hypothetical protein